ncbi:MAG: hypothetical protein RL189_3198 [Pseudomonadota bacterium]|jgi:lysine 2,3-aminomutase
MTSTSLEKSAQASSWARELRAGLVTLDQLAERGWLDPNTPREALRGAQAALDVRVPLAFHSGIADGDLALSRQFIPSGEEVDIAAEEFADPIGDEVFSPVQGLTHRYPDRVLVKITYQCAVYCRFCFRRHKVSHSEENLSYEALQAAYEYIEQHEHIREVIFTGGDPLVLTDARLEPHLRRIEQIPHVESLRFHTRVPVALPERITPELCARLAALQKMVWVVIHTNCASELNENALAAIARLRSAGIPLASQSVLLRGVNDSTADLEQLFRALYRNGIKPYYLHYPDLAKGTAHFRIRLSTAREIFEALKGRLPGLAIPQLTIDIPQGHGKITVTDDACRMLISQQQSHSGEVWEMRSPLNGRWIEVQYPRSER